MTIRLYGDPVLRETARDVGGLDEDLRRLIADMGETMYAASGIGLAANQVGETRRVLVVDTDQLEIDGKGRRTKRPDRRRLVAFVNAHMTGHSDDDGPYDEGCLSIPGLERTVYRPNRVKVRYLDEDGTQREEWFDGLLARVLQHEIDHLDGKLFIDRLDPDERASVAMHLQKVRRGEVRLPMADEK